MENEIHTYRARTGVGEDAPNYVNVKLDQTYEFINILSLQLRQTNMYQMPSSGFGCVVGRVIANGGFGIPNAKVSIFVPVDETVFDVQDGYLYNYTTSKDFGYNGVRYNLLPSYVDKACHQDVGTMFEKEYVLDNNDIIRVFDKYYSYTTVSNSAGDYMIYGIPVGQHTVHVDLDLSDIGVLSQKPRDMMYKGYAPTMFENPNKFKGGRLLNDQWTGEPLNNLAQIKTFDVEKYIYSFWGDTTENSQNAVLTRCDIEVPYQFEPTCVFMGSIISDKGGNSISHDCIPSDNAGKMSEMITGPGRIEMIRKTFDGKVEQFSIKGNQLINSDGVWCYQIPMNLDYVMTDEFGNLVPTDNPNKGIPTRARVRFRIYMDETEGDLEATKRARFLVPNNQRLTSDYPIFCSTHEPDYEFGTYTKDENYRDLFWNNVYTVKSYIPRLQKKTEANNKRYSCIKTTNHPGDNNPMPYNNIRIRMTFMYVFLCILLKLFIWVVMILNAILTWLGNLILDILGVKIWKWRPLKKWYNSACRAMSHWPIGLRNICSTNGEERTWYLGVDDDFYEKIRECNPNVNLTDDDKDELFNCIENQLAQDNEVTHFNFQNDWVNGVLYAPQWSRKIKSKKSIFFGLIKIPGVDRWCDAGSPSGGQNTSDFSDFWSNLWNGRKKPLKIYQTCAPQRNITGKTKLQALPKGSNTKDGMDNEDDCFRYNCHKKSYDYLISDKGIVYRKETMLDEYVYYYKPVEYDDRLFRLSTLFEGTRRNGDVKLMYATDIVLLGSLNDCDKLGIPQFFKYLPSTTHVMPPDLLTQAYNYTNDQSEDESMTMDLSTLRTEYTGADWGNAGSDQYGSEWYAGGASSPKVLKEGNEKYSNGGVYYGIDCTDSYTKPKSCINLSRACEYGITVDQSQDVYDFSTETVHKLTADGFISYDEIDDMDRRAMFATMNGNNLRTRISTKTGYPEYDFIYLYPENFDGSLQQIMSGIPRNDEKILVDGAYVNTPPDYVRNYNLEKLSLDYIHFRFNELPPTFNTNDDGMVDNYQVNYYTPSNRYSSNTILYKFPRYENSFYFYFGLKSGKTAIDQFRNDFYADCKTDEEGTAALGIDYQPKSWCSNDGYIKIDASFAEPPFQLTVNNRDSANDFKNATEINAYQFYIGAEQTNSELDGYSYIPLVPSDGSSTTPITFLPNGYYTLTLTDANENVYNQDIEYNDQFIQFGSNGVNFIQNNEELMTQFGDYRSIAMDSTSGGSLLLRRIGGYINIYDIQANYYYIKVYWDEPDFGSYDSEVGKYLFAFYRHWGDDPSQWGFINTDGFTNVSNGQITFGMPYGNKNYTIIVGTYCQPQNGIWSEDCRSDNKVIQNIYINEGNEYIMFANGVNTALLKDFTPGWTLIGQTYVSPYIGYNESTGITTNQVVGWLDFNQIGDIELLSPIPDCTPVTYQSYVWPIVSQLTPTTGIYKWTNEYVFDENTYEIPFVVYNSVPSTANPNTDPWLIAIPEGNQHKVLRMDITFHYTQVSSSVIPSSTNVPEYGSVPPDSTVDCTYPEYIKVNNGTEYEYYQKDESGVYSNFTIGGTQIYAETITLEQYFDNSNSLAQNIVIDDINNIVQMRFDLLEKMRNGFWVRDNITTASITTQTNDIPVKTMIYVNSNEEQYYYTQISESDVPSGATVVIMEYVPDEDECTANSDPYIKVLDPDDEEQETYLYYALTSRARTNYNYYRYDTNLEETDVYGITQPTITVKDDKPIFNKNDHNNVYQRPIVSATATYSGQTRPVGLPYQCAGNNGAFMCASTDMSKMFAMHLVDKRQSIHGVMWVPCNGFEYIQMHGADVTELAGNTFTMNGYLAGYFYNGFSTADTTEAEFEECRLAENVDMFTITTIPGTNRPNEYAVPTKRLIKKDNQTVLLKYHKILDGTVPSSSQTVINVPEFPTETSPYYIYCTTDNSYYTLTAGVDNYYKLDPNVSGANGFYYDNTYTAIKMQYTPTTPTSTGLYVTDEVGVTEHSLMCNLTIRPTPKRTSVLFQTVYKNLITNSQEIPMTYYAYYNMENPIYQRQVNGLSDIPFFMNPNYTFPTSDTPVLGAGYKVGENMTEFTVRDTITGIAPSTLFIIGVYEDNGLKTCVVSKTFEISNVTIRQFTSGSDTYYGLVYKMDNNYMHSYLKNYTFGVYYNGMILATINPATLTSRTATVTEYGSTHTYYYLDITNYQDIIDHLDNTGKLYVMDITGTITTRASLI